MRTLRIVSVLSVLFATLACAGQAPVGASPGACPEGSTDVAYKRFRNLEETETLDFVSADQATIYFTGRYDDRAPLTGSWSQSGAEITLELGSVTMSVHQTGRCSLAVYRKAMSDGSTWASGELRDDGKNLVQPLLYEQKWPACSP
ncbi:MAG: hypothetical protein H6737_14720 [Alphaproteobacteria bacterium]|nr:hypothetical protein [Alphaproteobacteria bacterium]